MDTESNHSVHTNHSHVHGQNCVHTKVKHSGHVDFLHDGDLHSPHEGHVDEHSIEVSVTNPNECTPTHTCKGHDKNHQHGPGCGHETVPHGDHVDYLVDGHLHHSHGGHCDDHGKLDLV
ncbi:MAG: hypothetical protein SGJ18_03470 [Pseudomonadota bacterium]|nr:hypothetical protein [Pseudomonadota bacterium]